jgi:uncharacterized surface protein with fasciclin (FAS1) repeats
MTSMGPATPSTDMTHMYTFTNSWVQTKPLSVCTIPGSILDFVHTNENLSQFYEILKKSNMAFEFNDNPMKMTLFAVPNEYMPNNPSFYQNMDRGTARQIITMLTMNKQISGSILVSCPSAYYSTLNKDQRLFVTNTRNGTTINNTANIINYDIVCKNGVVHILNKLLFPTDATFVN